MKKYTKKQEELMKKDEILISLKERYFKLARTEKIGRDAEMTKTIDNLEAAITKRISDLLSGKE